MGLYARHVIPRLVNLCCAASSISRQREKVVPRARGRVLEIGIGSGLNLAFYDRQHVTEVWAIDPSRELTAQAAAEAERVGIDLHLADWDLDAASFDSVVVTYALCTVPDLAGTLERARRVLKPGGELLFSEHGLAPDPGVVRVQRLMNPVWRKLGGGCNLDRDIPAGLVAAGFELPWLETLYLPGARFLNYHSWGAAQKPAT